MRREERQERDEREEELQDKEEEMEEKCQNVHRNKTTLSTTVQTTNQVRSNIIGQKVEFIVPKRNGKDQRHSNAFCHRFHRLSPGGRLGGGEKTLGHISEHRFRFLACSGALRLLQVIALCILDINIL